jgi:ribosomal protein S18 acetylase RimI-like enzyme
MRPGRAGDLPAVLELWRNDVRNGIRDSVPGDDHMRRLTATFRWDAQSKVVDRDDGGIDGAALVFTGVTAIGTVAIVDASATRPDNLHDLIRWGIDLSRAAGAVAAQVWRGRGHSSSLDRIGMELVRPWWRMDRGLGRPPDEPLRVPGYVLRDASEVAADVWADVHNATFADHWRFWPRSEQELMAERPPALSLMALTPAGSPVALALSQIEEHREDPRSQPVGTISSVGTVPDHRRRGLATWLVAETLVRLYRGGARSASLYVDGKSPVRAYDAYSKLGFKLAFETEVWEATFR